MYLKLKTQPMITVVVFNLLFLLFPHFCSAKNIYPYGMVVTSQHLATAVGKQILDEGGNAIDAAVAVGYALSVVEPCCGNIGGGGFMLLHLANHQNLFLNFREKAPGSARPSLFWDKSGKPLAQKITDGYLAVAVPGTVMGLNTALSRYGTMPLTKVMAPAIALAEHGFVLDEEDAKTLAKYWESLKKQPNVAVIFGNNGAPLKAGDRLIQKELAHSLKAIARQGTSAFYQGNIAKNIVESSKQHGGVLTEKDFLDYTVSIQDPLLCHYKNNLLVTAPPPSSGGVILCEVLNILSGYPIDQLGEQSPISQHYILEAMRYAYADRFTLGDPDFVENPVQNLLSPSHAASIRQDINSHTRSLEDTSQRTVEAEKPQTTHYSILDKAGNAVAVTYTLNGNFGAKVMAKDTGFFLNNEMDDFALQPNIPNQFGLIQGQANAIAPGKRPLSSMTPTIVLNEDQVTMVLGAPGGSTIPTQVLLTLIRVFDFGFDLQKAVDAPRYHMQWLPNVVFMEKDAVNKKMQAVLEKMGYHFVDGSPYHTPIWGAVAAIAYDAKTNSVTGAMDKRRPQGAALKTN